MNVAIKVLERAALKSAEGQQLTLRSVAAKGKVDGLLFELEVEQRYVNAADTNVEVVYTFPLPYGAVLLGMEVILGGKTLNGLVVAKAQAEAQYEAAIEQGDTAIMLERLGDGLYTVNLGNLMAREEAVIRLRYGQLLKFEYGSVRITIPTAIAPRYGDPHKAGLQPHQVPTHDLLANYSFSADIVLTGDVARGSITSPSHSINFLSVEDGVAVSLAKNSVLDRDLVLTIDGLEGKTLTATGPDGEGTVALASFCPPADAARASLPVVLKILVDCSGSMAGASIAGARRAVHEVLKHLNPADKFSYSCFGSTVTHHAKVAAAEPEAVRFAAQAVSRTDANLGGTEMAAALNSVYKLGGTAAADILLVTDGEVWEVEELIANAVKAEQRIFAVGIGSAPAESLLRSLALKTRGACEFLTDQDDVEAAILRMFARMRQDSVSELRAQWREAPAWQLDMPGALFCGETMHVVAGFDGAAAPAVSLSWRTGDLAATLEARFEGTAPQASSLARIAAAMRMDNVTKEERLALALKYQLVSEATNLVIVHERAEGERALRMPMLQVQPQMMGVPAAAGAMMRSAPAAPAPKGRRLTKSASPRVEMCYDMQAVPQPGLTQFKRSLEQGERPVALDALAGEIPSSVFDMLLSLRDEGFADADILSAFLACLLRESAADDSLDALMVRMKTALAPFLDQEVLDPGVTGWRRKLSSLLGGKA